MKLFKNLSNSYKIAILTFFAGLFGFLITCFLIVENRLIGIPYGFLFSGTVIALLNFVTGLFEKLDTKKESATLTLLSIIIRFVFTVAVMVILALMNYRWGIKIFNLFIFVGMYTLSMIFTIVTFMKERRSNA